jgi:hypothetical protein
MQQEAIDKLDDLFGKQEGKDKGEQETDQG